MLMVQVAQVGLVLDLELLRGLLMLLMLLAQLLLLLLQDHNPVKS